MTWLKWKIVNLLGVFDCFDMVLCRRMGPLNSRVHIESGTVDVEDAGSGGGDMALHDHTEDPPAAVGQFFRITYGQIFRCFCCWTLFGTYLHCTSIMLLYCIIVIMMHNV